MPRNPVINRKNIPTLRQRSMSATDAAMADLAALARRLHVSQGSLVDAALRHLASFDMPRVAELLHLYGHLTDEEFAEVAKLAAAPTGGKPGEHDNDGGVATAPERTE